MDLKKEFELDPQKVKDGVWFNMDNGLPVYSSADVARLDAKGVSLVRVRPLGNINTDYKARLAELMRPLRKQRRRGGKTTDDLIEEKITEAASWDVIAETRNIEDDGVSLEQTPEARYDAMIKYPDLREEWLGYGTELYHFRMEEIADGAGNSPTPSATS